MKMMFFHWFIFGALQNTQFFFAYDFEKYGHQHRIQIALIRNRAIIFLAPIIMIDFKIFLNHKPSNLRYLLFSNASLLRKGEYTYYVIYTSNKVY